MSTRAADSRSTIKRAMAAQLLDGSAKRQHSRTVTPRPRIGLIPLTAAQQQLWYYSRLVPGNPVYNEAVVIRKEGPLQLDAFRRAFNELIRRHEIWRTTFHVQGGEPYQVINPATTYELPVTDLRRMSAGRREERVARWAAEEARRPYLLDRGPLLRPWLVRFAPDDHRLYLGLHHLIFDGVSLHRTVLPELVALYDAFAARLASPLAEPPLQYADYALSELERAQTGLAIERRLAYWREHLDGVSPLGLPVDHPRPRVQRFRGAMEPFAVSAELADRLRSIGRDSGVTLFQTLAAAFTSLLHRYTGHEDICFATVADLRLRPELEAMVGYCLTPLVLRIDVGDDPTFVEVLRRVHDDVLAALSHLVPFETLMRRLRVERDKSLNPIFQAALVLEPHLVTVDPAWSMDEMDTTIGNAIAHSKFDVHVELDERPEGELQGRLIYDADLFEPDTARRMTRHWMRLLTVIAAQPRSKVSEMPLLSADELRMQLIDWNATDADYPRNCCVHDLVAAQAERTPDALAAVADDGSITYDDLNRRANQLAHRLSAMGADTGRPVAICVDRSLDMIVGLLGILKSGSAYVPLDPEYPRARLAFIIEDSGAGIVLTQSQLLARLPEHPRLRMLCLDRDADSIASQAEEPPATAVSSDDLAYVVYTSGSTGNPKGVPIRHSAVVNLLTSLSRTPGITSNDVALAQSTYSFDMSVPELWLPLITGARVVIVPREVAADGRSLARLIDDCEVTLMHATPTTWQMLLDAGWSGSSKLVGVSGGEAMSPALAEQLVERCAAVWNGYGPTEATAYTTFARVERAQVITIGRPIDNARVYILDRHQQPLPTGVSGEICISGDGLAHGYLHDCNLTASHFVDDPFVAGARMYRTGDLGRFLADGSIVHLGRIDDQVKLRGFRIEPGEIEAALLAHPDVTSAAVVLRESRDGDKRLVAYVVPEGEMPPAAELRALLRQSLPDHMLPSAYVALTELPRTASGKLDRRTLPAPGSATRQIAAAPGAPRGELEEQLARIWARVLKVDHVGVDDDFFELGGHSLLVVRVLAEVAEELGFDMTVAALIDCGATVARQAAYIAAARQQNPATNLLARIQPDGARPPLFFVVPGASPMFVRHFLGSLGTDQPVTCVLGPAQHGPYFDPSHSVEELAETRVRAIREAQPRGPYYIVGFSLGGVLAYEIAGQLRAAGEQVGWLCILDAAAPAALARSMRHLRPLLKRTWRRVSKRIAHQRAAMRAKPSLKQLEPQAVSRDGFDGELAVRLTLSYECHSHDAPLALFVTRGQSRWFKSPALGWTDVHRGSVEIQHFPVDHQSMIQQPGVATVAERLAASLRAAQDSHGAVPM